MARFTDLDLNFARNPLTGDINTLTDSDAVKASVRHAVLYNFFEKPFKPRFGGNVIAQLFENINPITAINIRDFIIKTVKDNEPRAILRNVNVIPSLDQNAFNVNIEFLVSNSNQPVKLDFSLERLR
jgi:phage baseplate assembly protein W|tara:strand:- start:3103 stop:3483 length:381 start_codon:yes stop_codon:yes gene_type:complete